ncbi:hypothetical protein E4U21_004125 [Claviceps maximensis]|nr:hypothetical protein E4U21_004125 [Claviceps maximensis]
MGMRKRRSDAITNAISRALNNENHRGTKSWGKAIGNFVGFFSLFRLDLTRHQYAEFYVMRHDFWDIDDDEYTSSFQSQPHAAHAAHAAEQDQGQDQDQDPRPRSGNNHPQEPDLSSLEPAGDLGYSGSSFFHTSNGKYLVKSLDRVSESDFFTKELFDPYTAHMKTHPSSLLVHITDVLYAPRATLGTIFGIQPRHYIIMENLLYGLGKGQGKGNQLQLVKWETFDLKPDDYFFPERDVAGGRLASDEVIDGLVDEFSDQIRVPPLVKQELLDILTEDTKFLARQDVVDYSLFLARFPKAELVAAAASTADGGQEDEDDNHDDVGNLLATSTTLVSPSWRTGVPSTDGKWIYRAVLLDFMWAKHKMQARAMTGLIGALNFLLRRKEPMSITADPGEYQARFTRMVERLLSRPEEGTRGRGTAAGSDGTGT